MLFEGTAGLISLLIRDLDKLPTGPPNAFYRVYVVMTRSLPYFVVIIVILIVFVRISAAPLHVELPLTTVGETEVCVVECEAARCDGDSVERPLFEAVEFYSKVPNCREIPFFEHLVPISTFAFLLLSQL